MTASANLTIERFEIGDGKYVWTILENRGDMYRRLGQAKSRKRVMEILATHMDLLDKKNDEIYSDLYD
jgi:hypothetical protein